MLSPKRPFERLKALTDMPLAEQRCLIPDQHFDPWGAFDGVAGSYNDEIDVACISVLRRITDGNFFAADALEEFFAYLLCGHDYCDYGTSPRGCFCYPEIKPLLHLWADKWEEFLRLED